MPEASEFQRRLPSIYRKIAEVKQEDIRISFIGRVVDKQDNTLVIDDGTGKALVTLDQGDAELDSDVRVLGRVMHSEKGFEIQGEFIQKIGSIDIELFKKIEHAWGSK